MSWKKQMAIKEIRNHPEDAYAYAYVKIEQLKAKLQVKDKEIAKLKSFLYPEMEAKT